MAQIRGVSARDEVMEPGFTNDSWKIRWKMTEIPGEIVMKFSMTIHRRHIAKNG